MGKYTSTISQMKSDILKSLSELEKGYGKRKLAIRRETGIPMSILTVLLKELKHEGNIELIMIWSESTGMPNGSGYCLSGNLKN